MNWDRTLSILHSVFVLNNMVFSFLEDVCTNVGDFRLMVLLKLWRVVGIVNDLSVINIDDSTVSVNRVLL